MKVELSFLNAFNCAYNNSLPIYADKEDIQIGTCKMTVENNKYIGNIDFDKMSNSYDDSYLSCQWHISENELLTVDKLYLTKKVMDNDLAIQLKDAIVSTS